MWQIRCPSIQVKALHIGLNTSLLFQYLSKCVVGASLEEPEEEDDAKEEESIIAAPKEGCYEIVGTTKERGQNVEKPDYVKELVNVSVSLEIDVSCFELFSYK